MKNEEKRYTKKGKEKVIYPGIIRAPASSIGK